MKNLYLMATILVLALTLTVTAAAVPITYTANDIVGAGSVKGTITTDGLIGTLSSADVLSWSLTLTDLSGSATISSGAGDILFISSTNVTASATQLIFDFNSNGGFMNWFNPAACATTEWSFETTGSGTGCNGTTGNQWGVSATGNPTYANESGPVVFATTVPEPGTIGLLFAGLSGLLGLKKRLF